MRKYPAFIFATLFLSCGTEPQTNTAEVDLTSKDSLTVRDSIMIIQAAYDPMENTGYLLTNGKPIPDSINKVHLVPEIYEGTAEDSGTTMPYMFDLIYSDFSLYDVSFDNYTGAVTVFYDANRTVPVTTYNLVNGSVEGSVKAMSPEGDVMVSRLYENGICVASVKDLYAIDWTFNPITSALNIEKFADYKTTDAAGNTVIELGESMHPDNGEEQNDLYALIQKPVFENTFTVNEQPYTGKLVGYYGSRYVYFEMPFVAGKLHDTIRLYDTWGNLELEERFENGTLAETIYVLEESEMDGMAKPVIYLYPEEDMLVNVALNLRGKMTHSYPTYTEGGWKVKATQNGTLYDQSGQEYYALFWEGISATDFTYSDGFVVKGNETAEFLETSLAVLNLTRREANEFIMYWLPQMENNNYNLIHFSTTEYQEIAGLKITPQPESVIRIMMVWSPLENAVAIPQQNLYNLRVERKGFTVVEWGGKKQTYLNPSF